MSQTTLWTVALRSLQYFLRSHTAVALGISSATAVLVGALVVGDSVRGSLRKLVVDRLANIECLLHARVFFHPDIVRQLPAEDGMALAPCIVLSSSTVEKRTQDSVSRASQVQVLAFEPDFWNNVTFHGKPPSIGEDEVALNRSLAEELGATIGDELTLRIADLSGVPADNALGRRDSSTLSVPRQKLVAILPDEGVGGVRFLAGQTAPRNIFASIPTLQDVLECDDRVNASVVLSPTGETSQAAPQSQLWCDHLNLHLQPSLEDYGLTLTRHRRIFPDEKIDHDESLRGLPPEEIYDYFQLSSDQLVLDKATSSAVVRKLGPENATRLMTYLANSIAKVDPRPSDLSGSRSISAYESQHPDETQLNLPPGPPRPSIVSMSVGEEDPAASRPIAMIGRELEEISDQTTERRETSVTLLSREVPYSILVGVDRASELELSKYTSLPFEDLRVPYCWINTWLSEEIELAAGDWFQVKYFEPETVDGREVEKTTRMMVAGVVPIVEPIRAFRPRSPASYLKPPTIFNDPSLTPSVPGVTDQDSISKWDLPFKLENEISAVDDQYWNNHRLTPKVFMPFRYAASSRLFGSRFGNTTAIRIPAKTIDEAELRSAIEEALLETRSQKGLAFQPIRARQLASANGTTPFDMLFLSLSFFVIVAALLLVFLLFKLGIQQRSSELGILLAQGFRPNTVRNLLLKEFSLVAIAGAALGIALGVGYARVIVAGLESWWIGAISTRFLSFFVSWPSLTGGAVAGLLASLAAIFVALHSLSKQNALGLVRGQATDGSTSDTKLGRVSLAIAGFAAFGACGLMVAATGQTGMARAGSFFGSGMLLLGAALITIRQLIEVGASAVVDPLRGNLLQLAWKAVCRNPLRSSLALSLLSVATFLIASMGVFQISPSEKGYGGFNLLAESSQPIYRNIGSGRVRSDILGDDAQFLSDSTIIPMRARFGEDASCNNLFQVAQPTIFGVPPRLGELHEFSPSMVEFDWAATATSVDANPWLNLASPASGTRTEPIPVILDQNTAAWSLKQGASIGALIRLELGDRAIFFRTVGLLSNSVLQGKLLISQSNFEKLFPEINGYTFFMIRSGKKHEPQVVAQTLEKGWSDEGLDVTYSRETLAKYLGVQNTYISAFQSLGALGLLLGTFGLIAAQVRSVLERQREFALMRAVGFTPHRIARLLTLETAILLGGGLLTGVLCAAVALVPYILEMGPQLNLLNPVLMLFVVLLVGFLTAVVAVRVATKQPVLAGLRAQ